MSELQLGFPKDRLRAQVGQKVDATASTIVSAHSRDTIAFGVLVVYDEADGLLCKLPVAKAPIDKPLGITLRQHHSDSYQPKSSIAVLRKGRVWVEVDKVNASGDIVYLKFLEDGSAKFTGDKKDALLLKGAIFLEKSEGGLVPIEVNFVGGVA
jgi:hypothetical protein